jgi:hypothetical protein
MATDEDVGILEVAIVSSQIQVGRAMTSALAIGGSATARPAFLS